MGKVVKLLEIKINNLRNLKNLSLKFDKKVSLFFGENGSGKTSILESIFFFNVARSFRSNKLSTVITHQQEKLNLFAKFSSDQQEPFSVGIEKGTEGPTKIACSAEKIKTLAELGSLIPMQILSAESFKLLNSGSKERISLLDWGVFHVEHEFINAWKKYKAALRQRNNLLKNRVNLSLRQLSSWDKELAYYGEIVSSLRKKYAETLIVELKKLLSQHEILAKLTVEFFPGWDPTLSLAQALSQAREKDFALGYTSCGPQRADLRFLWEQESAGNQLSRGQQKRLICLLFLAQISLLDEQKKKNLIFLIDDLAAELDTAGRKLLLDSLLPKVAQLIITGVEAEPVLEVLGEQVTLFQVKHGHISQIINQAEVETVCKG